MEATFVPFQWRLSLFKKVWLAVLLASAMSIFLSITVGALVGLGGLLSEQLLDMTGVANSGVSISRIDTSATSPVIGMGGIVTTNTPTNITPSSIELHGTLTSLNGAPQATVYFDWGYSSAMGNDSASTVVFTTGPYSIPLTGFDETQEIFFRAAVDTDGTAYGSISRVTVSTSAIFLRLIIPLIIATGVILLILKTESANDLITAVMGGLVAYIISRIILESLI